MSDVNRATRDFYTAFFRENPSASIDDAARAASAEKRGVVVNKDAISSIRRMVRLSSAIRATPQPQTLTAPIVEHVKRIALTPMESKTVKPTPVVAPAVQPQTAAPETPKKSQGQQIGEAVKAFVAALETSGLEFTTFDLSIDENNEAQYVYEVVEKRSGKVVL